MRRRIRPTDLHQYDEFLMTLKDATEEEKQLAFNLLVKNNALDIARMLDL